MTAQVSRGAPVTKYGDNCDVGEVISFRLDSPTHTIISLDRRRRRLHLEDDSSVSMNALFYIHEPS